jgi:ABC-2 type transport system ATP-binding protein
VAEFIASNSVQSVRVRTPDPLPLVEAITRTGGRALAADDGAIVVQGLTAPQIGDLAFGARIPLHELAASQASLEEAFMELTAASVEFRARTGAGGAGTQHGGTQHSTEPAQPTGVA